MTKKDDSQAALCFPFDDSLDTLSLTAQSIIAAARRLLERQGYRGISYEKVATEAEVDKGTIRYNFGNKANLLTAVVDSIIHDECLALARARAGRARQDTVRHTVAGIHRLILAGDAQRGWFDILPHALRNAELNRRICGLYEWWYRLNLESLGIPPERYEGGELERGIAALFAAVVDGLAIQVALGTSVDLDASLAALERMLTATIDALPPSPEPEGSKNAGDGP